MQPLSLHEQAILGEIDPASMLAEVMAWAAINSGTGNLVGLAQIAGMLAESFSKLPGALLSEPPAPVMAIAIDGAERQLEHGQHIVIRVRPDAPRRILLTGHMDTVFPADHPFQTLKWLDETTLNGPGVADMKGGIAVMLAALMAFEQSDYAEMLGYDVLLNADEETGSLSSAPLIAALAQRKIAALTYEPSALPDGTLAGARGGSGNYSAVITGKSAHAGRNPQDGRNAIVAAADLAVRLKALTDNDVSLNPARIDGGSGNNVVPDHAVLRFNIRPATSDAGQRVDQAIRSLISQIALAHDVSIHLHGGMSRPPKPVDHKAQKLFDLVKDCGAALGQPIRWQASGGVCDGNNIAACGVPVVDTMGVRGGAIHSSDEYLIVPSLAERAALSALTIMRLAQGAAL